MIEKNNHQLCSNQAKVLKDLFDQTKLSIDLFDKENLLKEYFDKK